MRRYNASNAEVLRKQFAQARVGDVEPWGGRMNQQLAWLVS